MDVVVVPVIALDDVRVSTEPSRIEPGEAGAEGCRVELQDASEQTLHSVPIIRVAAVYKVEVDVEFKACAPEQVESELRLLGACERSAAFFKVAIYIHVAVAFAFAIAVSALEKHVLKKKPECSIAMVVEAFSTAVSESTTQRRPPHCCRCTHYRS
ncbi:hypothetical protein P153DRAFT_145521 [Dothidotthia symphoricarpi CBS 119687]|uniref:Uncharacterized protein n=1 Tax=Dothidotthia symphoricarpi CBS 119687 TaxID=1392245 RepID=A0A6A5ZVJ3_9PLEO|nr:uncharacterized protein P153DRAFT_145521 [Dothidotthia symphoricarpi CBS 119687]KAF2123752.1 hypothetical protein P153DRAFT_145521 [Dothidotthia symphoricarpi CBS 119687]